MCYLCLQDFDFELPIQPELEQKKKRLVKIKSLLTMSEFLAINAEEVCDNKVEALKEEQYKLSREF
jgi:pyruvate formate-lyase activating enzyme-like uncharacterized protein